MKMLPNGTYQLDGIDITALVLGPVMIIFGLSLSPFFLFAGIGLLLLVAWSRTSFKIIAIFFAIMLFILIGFFSLLIAPEQLLALLFGAGPATFAYISLLPLIFTGTISILGITCAIKKNDKLTDSATIAFSIFAFITAALLAIPPTPSVEFTGVLWVFMVNFLVLQFGYVVVFSLFYYAVYYAHRTGKKYFQHLKVISLYNNPDLLEAEERKQFEEIFGPSPMVGPEEINRKMNDAMKMPPEVEK